MADKDPPSPKHEGDILPIRRRQVKPAMTVRVRKENANHEQSI